MAEHSTIEWTDATWNPITGCSVVSPGCTHCYAMRLAGTRLQHHPTRAGLTRDSKAGPVWTGEVRFNAEWLDQPLRWHRPRMIFVCAHGDLFHEGVPDEWIDRVFAVMALAPQHTFQVLSKRAERMRAYMSNPATVGRIADAIQPLRTDKKAVGPLPHLPGGARWWPLPNVWLGVSAEDQQRAEERIPLLLATPAAVRWVSAEPLLGPVDLVLRGTDMGDWDVLAGREYWAGTYIYRDSANALKRTTAKIDWVVAGGESGPGARPMHPDWARSLRDQCAAAGVPFNFKQHGEFVEIDGINCKGGHGSPGDRGPDVSWLRHDGTQLPLNHGMNLTGPSVWGADVLIKRVGKKAAGRLLDGVEHNGMPGQ